jgi:histidyl-tRNA synthetase
MNRKLNKALNYANTVGINKVILIGEKELVGLEELGNI